MPESPAIPESPAMPCAGTIICAAATSVDTGRAPPRMYGGGTAEDACAAAGATSAPIPSASAARPPSRIVVLVDRIPASPSGSFLDPVDVLGDQAVSLPVHLGGRL